MDEETELGRLQTPATLGGIGRLAPDGAQEGDMRTIEISQTLDIWEEHQGDEVQGRDVGEIPFHVRQNEETERVCRRWRAEKYFLGLRPTREDIVYPAGWSLEWGGPGSVLRRTIGCASLGTRLYTALRCVRTTRAFRARCGFAVWSTVQKSSRLFWTPS